MKYQALAALLALVGTTRAHNAHQQRHAHHRRQDPAATTTSSTTTNSVPTQATSQTSTGTDATSTGTTTGSGTSTGSTTTSASTTAVPTTISYGTSVPPLSEISLGMPSGFPYTVTTTYAPGVTPPISGAPALPSMFVYSPADGWPTQDQVPPTDSKEVQEWMKELEGYDIPDIPQTVDGTCGSDPAAAADAANRGWWTCGGYTRDTDIVQCPDRFTWGVSFDDGPGPFTGKLLGYLNEKDIAATFFVVGSRVIERPGMLIDEYMSGHEISVHTWSHRHLTTLTNEQIVAELGWTRKAIQTVLGVTPTTMRPPYGDIDDRVRAICLAMGLNPIMWTRTKQGVAFDTFDWEAAGGLVTGQQSYDQFQGILGNASSMDNGFIVLQHDLYEITVDIAMGYTLAAAQTHNPAFTLKPIGECSNIPATDLYRETNTNTSFPYPNAQSGIDADGDGTVDTGNTAGGINNDNSGGNGDGAFANAVPSMSMFFALAMAALGSVL